jgi:hypothetical protein
MTVYKGGFRKTGPRLFWRPVCFTNGDKAAFWAAATIGGAAEGALAGFVIGAVIGGLGSSAAAATGIGALLTAMVTSAAAVTGLVIGAVVGACYGFWLAWNAACPECGSCIEILGIQTLWPFSLFLPSVIPVVPIVARPSTADCPMIPPGCP